MEDNTERKVFKGLLIDPVSRTITEVDVIEDENECIRDSLCKHLECKMLDKRCSPWWEVLPGSPEADLWCDADRNKSDKTDCFSIPECAWKPLNDKSTTIVGRGLILGTRGYVTPVSHDFSPEAIEELYKIIDFKKRRLKG